MFKLSDFIRPFLGPYLGVIPNQKMAFISPISCILALLFPILIKHFPKCEGKGSFLKSQIKSLKLMDKKILTILRSKSLLLFYVNCMTEIISNSKCMIINRLYFTTS